MDRNGVVNEGNRSVLDGYLSQLNTTGRTAATKKTVRLGIKNQKVRKVKMEKNSEIPS